MLIFSCNTTDDLGIGYDILPDEDKILLGFNVKLSEDTDVDELKEIKIITDSIIYKLIENFEEWRENKLKEIERQKLKELPAIAKIKILDFVFRNSNPAVFGVEVNGGILKKGERFINKDNEKIGQIKEMQEDKNNVQEATQGKEVAISVPGVNFERQLKVGEALYTNLSETEFRKSLSNYVKTHGKIKLTERVLHSKICYPKYNLISEFYNKNEELFDLKKGN